VAAPDWLFHGALCLAACGGNSAVDAPTPLEAAIDRGLTERFGVPVVTACTGLIPPCKTLLPDGTVLPIELAWRSGGWDWRVRGLVITTDQLEAYLRDEVADLGAPQGVRCAPRIRAIVANERIECWLARGGKAFVDVHADGTTAVELVLDAAAANARSELVTPARERELEATSRALAHMADDEADDEDQREGPSPPDAGDTR
jgi:hypothetical protein